MALQDKKIMPPPWLAHREIERYSIGWRMGYGEDYIDRFGDWLDTLSPEELTCAEAMFMACNEYYHLNLSEETRKMFSVMGLGMQTEQSCCGAFTVAVGIIGLMTAKEGQTDVSNMEGYQMIAELTEFMLGFYGTLHCVELQRLEIVGYENPCHAIVEALAKKLEELLANRRIFCPANGGQLSC